MDMSRRFFLRGALAVSALSIAPAIASMPTAPLIVGDGIHDDTAGLEAALNRRPFRCDGHIVSDQGSLDFSTGATFRTSRTVMVQGQKNMNVSGCVNILRDHSAHALELKEIENMRWATLNVTTTERARPLAEKMNSAAIYVHGTQATIQHAAAGEPP